MREESIQRVLLSAFSLSDLYLTLAAAYVTLQLLRCLLSLPASMSQRLKGMESTSPSYKGFRYVHRPLRMMDSIGHGNNPRQAM
jgi:hypothetical protein